jgi:hypothetical protein
MPDLTGQAATFRAGKYAYTGYLAIIPQTVVCAATVDSTPTFPAMSLTITVTAGDIADVERGMTVRVESAAGAFKGLLRVASTGTLNATTLPINEVAAGTVNIAGTDVLKIVSEWRIWDKLVSATAALNKDSRLAYTDQLADPPPVANAGGAAVGWGATANIAFDASTSYAVDPDNTGGLTYAWDFGDGTPSTSATATETVSFPAGFRWVKLTVTDADNSTTTEKFVPVWVYDNSTLSPVPVIMSSLEGDVRTGWRASFELVDTNAAVSTLPDGALVVYVERETYAGSEASYGSNAAARSNIKFIGYLTRDTISIEPDNNTVRFDAEGPLGILERTPALTQLMISDATPANWQEVKTLTVQRALWYLWHWQATVGTLFDTLAINGGSLGNLSLLRIAVTDVSSAAGQLRDVASATNLMVSADRLGRLTFVREFDYLDSTDRTARTKTYDLTTADALSVELTREHRGTTKFVRGEGITTAGAPVFSNAPGNAPSPMGTASETFSRQIVSGQADLNTRAGLHFARVNSLYNGQFVPRGVQINLPDGYDVFDPAYGEAVTLTLAAATNKRGVSFGTGTRWTIPRVSISHDADRGAKAVRVTLDHETTGPVGVTYVPPVAADIGLSIPSFDFSYELPGFAIDYDTSRGTFVSGTLAIFGTNGYLYTTGDFGTPSGSGGPTWTGTDLTGLANWDGTIIRFVVDAYSPGYVGGGTAVNGWILTTTSILRITDIFGTPALALRHTFAVVSSARHISATRGMQNHVVASGNYVNDGTYPGVYVTYTTDDSTYTEVEVTAHYNTQPRSDVPWVHISERETGVVYVPAYTNTSSFNSSVVELHKSADYGATWAVSSGNLAFTSQYVLPRIFMPYSIGTANIMYRGDVLRSGINDVYSMYRVSGSTNTAITPATGGNIVEMVIDDANANNALFSSYGGASNMFTTAELGYPTPTYSDVTADAAGAPLAINASAMYVTNTSKMLYSGDFGGTWDNRIGNIAAAIYFVGLCGG